MAASVIQYSCGTQDCARAPDALRFAKDRTPPSGLRKFALGRAGLAARRRPAARACADALASHLDSKARHDAVHPVEVDDQGEALLLAVGVAFRFGRVVVHRLAGLGVVLDVAAAAELQGDPLFGVAVEEGDAVVLRQRLL